VPRVSARFSESLARRRFHSSQEKARLTPIAGAERRNRSCRPIVQPAMVSTAVGPDQFEPREATAYFAEDESCPIASWIAAEWTTARIGSPSLSSRTWISRPSEGLASRPPARRHMQLRPDRFPGAAALKLAKDVVDGRAWRKAVARQTAPGATGAQQIQNGVHRRAHVGFARSPARRRLGDQRLQPRSIPHPSDRWDNPSPQIRCCSSVHIALRHHGGVLFTVKQAILREVPCFWVGS
jgi:hypothetical protein